MLSGLEAEPLLLASSKSATPKVTSRHSAAHSSSTASEEGLEDVVGVDIVCEGMSAAAVTVEVLEVVAGVVAAALLGVGENAVGLADLLELLFVIFLLVFSCFFSFGRFHFIFR